MPLPAGVARHAALHRAVLRYPFGDALVPGDVHLRRAVEASVQGAAGILRELHHDDVVLPAAELQLAGADGLPSAPLPLPRASTSTWL